LDELYVDIPGFPRYAVSNYGIVINKDTDRELSRTPDSNGYVKVKLYTGGVGTTKYVHRLVAQAFFVDYSDSLEVLLISEDRSDCSVRNIMIGWESSRRHR